MCTSPPKRRMICRERRCNLNFHAHKCGHTDPETMKVFICWSGDRSGRIAAFLREWLPSVLQNIDPFMSTEDIGKGLRWTDQLSSQLEVANFGIVCLTPENLSAPWLHFEAGALSKLTRSHVVPILFQLKSSDVQGPLSQFQAVALDKHEEMLRLLTGISEAAGTKPDSNWRRTFQGLWHQVTEQVDAIAAENKIEITSPKNDEDLEDPKKFLEGHRYRVQGTLKYLPPHHSVWLLNSGPDGKQWPQQAATYDSISRKWEGHVYLQRWVNGTLINAVVTPPTSQQFFEYYRSYGAGNPLSGVPDECENIAQVRARNPRHRVAS
jgi:hypothetical protein